MNVAKSANEDTRCSRNSRSPRPSAAIVCAIALSSAMFVPGLSAT